MLLLKSDTKSIKSKSIKSWTKQTEFVFVQKQQEDVSDSKWFLWFNRYTIMISWVKSMTAEKLFTNLDQKKNSSFWSKCFEIMLIYWTFLITCIITLVIFVCFFFYLLVFADIVASLTSLTRGNFQLFKLCTYNGFKNKDTCYFIVTSWERPPGC